MLGFLDVLFTFLHLAITGFNLVGWIWRKTRRLHLIVVTATAGSWFLLGIWYGWGYCFLTDWHWEVKRRLGEVNLPNSFIKYYADRITGLDFDAGFIDRVTLVTFIAVILVTAYVNISSHRKSARRIHEEMHRRK